MYGFDIGMHVSDNLGAIEKKEKAEAEAKRANARAQAQAQAQARAEAQSQPQAQSQDKGRKQKPPQMMLPFNAFQAQMQKAAPGSVRPPTAAQRPGAPNRTISFPTFSSTGLKPGGTTPVTTGSGLSSLAASAYNSPLPSPGLNAPSKNAWFPFGPTKHDGGDSNTSVSRPWPCLSVYN
ncbi:hypothetical protein BDV97DRAFT_372130 [Delphinella strobiligena]|nr:hypothetical protein BDV97DRAFT_372130 [Delphinella strobiligena]